MWPRSLHRAHTAQHQSSVPLLAQHTLRLSMSEYARIEISIANTHSPVESNTRRADRLPYTPRVKEMRNVSPILVDRHTVCGFLAGNGVTNPLDSHATERRVATRRAHTTKSNYSCTVNSAIAGIHRPREREREIFLSIVSCTYRQHNNKSFNRLYDSVFLCRHTPQCTLNAFFRVLIAAAFTAIDSILPFPIRKKWPKTGPFDGS